MPEEERQLSLFAFKQLDLAQVDRKSSKEEEEQQLLVVPMLFEAQFDWDLLLHDDDERQLSTFASRLVSLSDEFEAQQVVLPLSDE